MDFGTVITALGICVALPLVCVWLIVYMKNHETNKRTEVILAAIEKNADVNVDGLFKKLNSHQRSVKERVVKKLTSGLVISAVGLGCLCIAIWMSFHDFDTEQMYGILFAAIIPLFVGISNIIAYLICKKELASEIEKEEMEKGNERRIESK